MIQYLPGTVVETDIKNCNDTLTVIFSKGGLMLFQICRMTGLEPHTVQNWVKRGFIPSPQKKEYSRRQFCRIAIINILKDSLPLDSIKKLMAYINGGLDDGNGNYIDESRLYLLFSIVISDGTEDYTYLNNKISETLENYHKPSKASAKKLEEILRIMVAAYLSSIFKKKAALEYASLDSFTK